MSKRISALSAFIVEVYTPMAVELEALKKKCERLDEGLHIVEEAQERTLETNRSLLYKVDTLSDENNRLRNAMQRQSPDESAQEKIDALKAMNELLRKELDGIRHASFLSQQERKNAYISTQNDIRRRIMLIKNETPALGKVELIKAVKGICAQTFITREVLNECGIGLSLREAKDLVEETM